MSVARRKNVTGEPTDAIIAARRRRIDTVVGYRLVLLVNLQAQSFSRAYGKKFRISINEWRIMLALAGYPGIHSAEASYLSGLSKMNVSRGLRILQRRGLVSVRPDAADGRRKILKLTPAGEVVLEAVLPIAESRNEAMWGHLSAVERRKLCTWLDRAIEVARQPI